MNGILRFIKRYPLSLVVVAFILYLSFFKPPKEKVIHIDNLDKLAHFCMYAGFCSVVWLEYFFSHSGVSYRRVIIGAVVAPIIFSGLIEIVQGNFTSYRGMDWYDFLFNILGVFFALFFAKFFIRPWVAAYKNKKNSKG
ncbi:MAG: VanZ family protein [Bacteroidaceae bacterium]|nr:VanZ family protein [Bacteroidaceae bacterium]